MDEKDRWTTRKGVSVHGVTRPELPVTFVVSDNKKFIVKLRTEFSSRVLNHSFMLLEASCRKT